ncbi:DUF3718 domain-containing protein [Thalassotalea litorea]|uniref:DUF3718 domain-containing protein n=1 Tax=Thalassotalea litorea TaxID=2020715 RepID=A0A5R9IRY1_9GAMM|nr:DUF3718 domain-containing protein [Thalassotalea litorea]TLU66817.1 DUF3718 domain-containing protein [Thalassotalea litorea]
MKTLMSAIATALIVASASSQAVEHEFIAADNSNETKTCISAASDDLSSLKKYVRRSFDNNVRLMSHALKCNDQDINTFAHTFGAQDTSEYLNGKVSSKYRIDDSVQIIDTSAYQPDTQGKVVIIVSSK